MDDDIASPANSLYVEVFTEVGNLHQRISVLSDRLEALENQTKVYMEDLASLRNLIANQLDTPKDSLASSIVPLFSSSVDKAFVSDDAIRQQRVGEIEETISHVDCLTAKEKEHRTVQMNPTSFCRKNMFLQHQAHCTSYQPFLGNTVASSVPLGKHIFFSVEGNVLDKTIA